MARRGTVTIVFSDVVAVVSVTLVAAPVVAAGVLEVQGEVVVVSEVESGYKARVLDDPSAIATERTPILPS